MIGAVQVLQKEDGERIGALPIPIQAQLSRHSRLPGVCPRCGAAPNREELTWSDLFTTK
jgi:hypothetical protein